jgi:hypothetical protein
MTEAALQSQIVEYLGWALPNALVLHLHNNPRSAIEGAKLKRMGLVKGAPDLLVCLPRGQGMFLEVKTSKGRVSPAQFQFHNRCVSLAWPVAVVRSIDDVKRALVAVNVIRKGGDDV